MPLILPLPIEVLSLNYPYLLQSTLADHSSRSLTLKLSLPIEVNPR